MKSVLNCRGIYRITNLVNQNFYIGSSENILRRKNGHLRLLRLGTHYNKHLQASYNKHGEENFDWSVEEIIDEGELFVREDEFISQLRPIYNKQPAQRPRLGIKQTPESIAKIQESRALWSDEKREEIRKKLSDSHKGKDPWNKGKKGLQVGWRKGKVYSEEERNAFVERTKNKNDIPIEFLNKDTMEVELEFERVKDCFSTFNITNINYYLGKEKIFKNKYIVRYGR